MAMKPAAEMTQSLEKRAIRVVVTGAAGRMGREVVKAVANDGSMKLVGAVDKALEGQDIGIVTGAGALGVRIESDLKAVLERLGPDVMVDFTTPAAVKGNVLTAIANGTRFVVGTTGLSEADIEEIRASAEERQVGGLIVPNFALGAVLMMKFSEIAARFMEACEIIELHHDKKLDAPSGTAAITAGFIERGRGKRDSAPLGEPAGDRQGASQPAAVHETAPGVRGGVVKGIRIHSVRLPGLVAHQEVIFGGLGQALTIRHDSFSRESFMPGVLLAIRKVMELSNLMIGLDSVMDI